MLELTANTIHYFQAPKDYFWKWVENGTVLEFANGRTICYREDLTFILSNLVIPDQVPVGTVLLLLCACKDNYKELFEPDSYLFKLGYLPVYSEEEHIQVKQRMQQVLEFLTLVNVLPFEYRSGLKRIALFQAILEGEGDYEGKRLKSLTNEFKSGNLDEQVFGFQRELSYTLVNSDMAPLVYALQQFPATAALELKLRTGISALPQPAKVGLPAPVPQDLMEQLAADLKTAGIARLSKKIIAALNIPMHLSGSSDQSIGGVSDISNRGHFDKLLLSELAQDDLVLTARLANNEALFLQREAMPASHQQQWHIILDTTLKMWGMPRVFGLAAGLAFNESKKQVQMDAWALGGESVVEVDLDTRQGIITALEQLDTGLNCGPALKKLMTEQASVKDKYILITGAHYQQDAAFMRAFGQVKAQLDYLVEVDREGRIALYETLGKKHQLVNQALIDLNETLFTQNRSLRKSYGAVGLPAMLNAADFPLLFPASKIKLQQQTVFKYAGDRVAILTQDRRLLSWQHKDQGAVELIEQVESGDAYFGEVKGFLFMLIRNYPAATLKLYQVDAVNQTVLYHTIDKLQAVHTCFEGGLFHVSTADSVTAIDPFTGHQTSSRFTAETIKKAAVIPHFQVLNQVKKLINNGYSVVNSAKSIYVHTAGKLFVDQRELQLDPHGRFLNWKENGMGAVEWIKPAKRETMEIAHLPNLKFTKYVWADGSEAVLDSRGLLHLKSSDTRVAECTLLLVLEKTTAGWSADGKLTGNPYFTGNRQAGVMLAADFYAAYIQPFIQRLK
ncbi:MAG: hypothetical protein JWQ66_3714 [Mucilaginibacter sp.]|nr:hypothetical protein [Mucilaginibacter sp.]